MQSFIKNIEGNPNFQLETSPLTGSIIIQHQETGSKKKRAIRQVDQNKLEKTVNELGLREFKFGNETHFCHQLMCNKYELMCKKVGFSYLSTQFISNMQSLPAEMKWMCLNEVIGYGALLAISHLPTDSPTNGNLYRSICSLYSLFTSNGRFNRESLQNIKTVLSQICGKEPYISKILLNLYSKLNQSSDEDLAKFDSTVLKFLPSEFYYVQKLLLLNNENSPTDVVSQVQFQANFLPICIKVFAEKFANFIKIHKENSENNRKLALKFSNQLIQEIHIEKLIFAELNILVLHPSFFKCLKFQVQSLPNEYTIEIIDLELLKQISKNLKWRELLLSLIHI